MRNLTFWYVITLIGLFALVGQARETTPIERCLNVSTNRTSDCVNRHLKNKTLNKCYEMSETIYSAHSKENVKNHCFYNISEFPSLPTCVAAAKKFYMDENKDQALFDCYRQFSIEIDAKKCRSLSKMMSYRERRTYLENHCRTL